MPDADLHINNNNTLLRGYDPAKPHPNFILPNINFNFKLTMKKTALKTGRLQLKRMTVATLNDEAQDLVKGGIQVQPTTTVLPTRRIACITNSAGCPATRTAGCVQPTATVQPSFVC